MTMLWPTSLVVGAQDALICSKATFTVVHSVVYFAYSKVGKSSDYSSSFFTLTITTVDSDDSRHAAFRQ